jgi:hypothetical protein
MVTQVIVGFMGVLGIVFVIFGIKTIKKESVTLSDPEGIHEDRKFTGRQARVAGWCFAILGGLLVLGALLTLLP